MTAQSQRFNKDDHVKIGSVYRKKSFGEKFGEFVGGLILLGLVILVLTWVF